MAKLRFGKLDAEVEGDVKEIASLLRELNVINQSPIASITSIEDVKSDSNALQTASSDELYEKLPSRSELTQMIESIGKPFSFVLVEQQMKLFGRVINSREDMRLYSKFYEIHKFARNAITKKYGGHWKATNEVIGGHQTTRYTWEEDEENKPQENLGSYELHQGSQMSE